MTHILYHARFLRCTETPSPVKPLAQLQQATASAFAAAFIASSVLTNPLPAHAVISPTSDTAIYSTTQTVAAKVVREGIYGEFEYDLPDQKYDDARSTFKAAKETKSNKGQYRIGVAPDACCMLWQMAVQG
jgi:hypothetical protein